jgi:hypothetical protein
MKTVRITRVLTEIRPPPRYKLMFIERPGCAVAFLPLRWMLYTEKNVSDIYSYEFTFFIVQTKYFYI